MSSLREDFDPQKELLLAGLLQGHFLPAVAGGSEIYISPETAEIMRAEILGNSSAPDAVNG